MRIRAKKESAMMTGFGGNNRPSLVPRRNGLPLFGMVATVLISAQPMVGQGTPVTTWQSSPVLKKFVEEMRAPGKITV
jgi:hypothetical protein